MSCVERVRRKKKKPQGGRRTEKGGKPHNFRVPKNSGAKRSGCCLPPEPFRVSSCRWGVKKKKKKGLARGKGRGRTRKEKFLGKGERHYQLVQRVLGTIKNGGGNQKEKNPAPNNSAGNLYEVVRLKGGGNDNIEKKEKQMTGGCGGHKKN